MADICVAITTVGNRCTRKIRYGNLCTLHHNRNLGLGGDVGYK